MTQFKLQYKIDADARGVRSELGAVDSLIGKVGGSFASLASSPMAFAAGVGAIAAGAATAGVALFNLTKQASDFGSQIFDASKKTGLGAESLSAMKFAAEQSGTSIEAITGGIAKFSKAVGAAGDDAKKSAAFVKDFGISPQEAIKDLDGALGKVFKKIIDAPPGVERMTLAQKAFGKSGADLLPFLDSFDGDLAGLIRKAKELGVTIDDETARAADEFGDQLDTLGTQFEGVGRAIAGPFMKPFTEMAKGVGDFLTENKDDIATWGHRTSLTLQGLILQWKELKKAADNYGTSSAAGWLGRMNPAYQVGAYIGGDARRRATDANRITSRADLLRSEDTDRMGAFRGVGVDDGPTRGGGARTKTPRAAGADDRSAKQVYLDFVKALKAEGILIGKGQGYRSFEEQARLYRMLGPGEAAAPGKSDHNFYRGLDLDPNVSEERLQRAAAAARVTLGKPLFHQGTKYHRHQPFKKGLDEGGGGEAEANQKAEDRKKKLQEDADYELNLASQTMDQLLADEKQASEDRLQIRRDEADQTAEIIQSRLDQGIVSETEAVKQLGQLKLDLLKAERKEVGDQVSSRENLTKLRSLDIRIQTQEIANARELAAAEKKRKEEWEQFWDGYAAYLKNLDRERKIKAEIQAKENRRVFEAGTVGGGTSLTSGIFQGIGTSLPPMFDEMTNAMLTFDQYLLKVGEDINKFVGQSLGGMIDGLGQMAAAWLITGEFSAQAALGMIAATAMSIATQAGFKALMAVAEGMEQTARSAAAYAVGDVWGGSAHATAAGAFYSAAAKYGIIAGVAGGVGVAAGLGARAAGGGSGGGGGRGSDSQSTLGTRREQDLRPISRISEDAYISGRRDHIRALTNAVDKLQKKIGGINAGEILVAGSRQKRGFIGKQTTEDFKSNPQLGSTLMRRMGGR